MIAAAGPDQTQTRCHADIVRPADCMRRGPAGMKRNLKLNRGRLRAYVESVRSVPRATAAAAAASTYGLCSRYTLSHFVMYCTFRRKGHALVVFFQ